MVSVRKWPAMRSRQCRSRQQETGEVARVLVPSEQVDPCPSRRNVCKVCSVRREEKEKRGERIQSSQREVV